MLSVATMRVSNEDRSPVVIHGRNTAHVQAAYMPSHLQIFLVGRSLDVRFGSQHDNFSRERSARLSR